MRSTFSLLIIALIGTFVLVWFNRDSGFTFGLTNDDFVRAMSLVLLLAAVGFRSISGSNLGETARNLSIWGIIALGFVTALSIPVRTCRMWPAVSRLGLCHHGRKSRPMPMAQR